MVMQSVENELFGVLGRMRQLQPMFETDFRSAPGEGCLREREAADLREAWPSFEGDHLKGQATRERAGR
jgi:hypothetical protein